MNCASGRFRAFPCRIVFAVRRSLTLPLLLLLGIAIGCSTPRNSARYGWLRKKGAVSGTEAQATASGATRFKQRTNDATAIGISTTDEPVEPGLEASARTTPSAFIPHTGWGTGTTFEPLDLGTTGVPLASQRVELNIAGPDTAYYSEGDRHWNGKAIAAMPLALSTVIIGLATQSIYFLLIGGAISFTLGLIASRQCRDRRDRGKGFALAGMILGAAALFFSLMVLIWAA